MRIPLVLLMCAALAGCLGAAKPAGLPQDLAGQSGFLTLADGASLLQVSAGTLTAFALDARAGTGDVMLTGRIDGAMWRVQFAKPRPEAGQGWQGTGVLDGVDLDGGSSHGDTSRPLLKAARALWSTAHVDVDGVPRTGASGGPEWDARLVYAKPGIRDDRTHATTANGGTGELHVRLAAPPVVDPPRVFDFAPASMVVDANYQKAYRLEVPWAGSRLNATIGLWDAASRTNLTFRLLGPGGAVLAQWQLAGGEPGGTKLKHPGPILMGEAGPYGLQVFGQAVAANYTVHAEIIPPPAERFDFWFDDVFEGAAAHRVADQRALLT